jgi:hypothetical protein
MFLNPHPFKHQRNCPSHCGQSLSEYAIVLGLIVLVGIPALMLLGQQNQNGLGQVSQKQSDFDNLSGLLTTRNSTSVTNNTSGNGSIIPTDLSPSTNTSLTISSNTLQIGNNGSLQYGIDSNTGQLTFTDSRNSTSVEGSVVTMQLATQFKALAQEFNNNGSAEEADKFNDLAQKASDLSSTQGYLEKLGSIQSKLYSANESQISRYKDQYNQLMDQYQDFSKLSTKALNNLPNDSKILPKLTNLVALGQNITFKNFIQPLNTQVKIDPQNPTSGQSGSDLIFRRLGLNRGDLSQALKNEPIKDIAGLSSTAGSAETLQMSKDIQALP